MSATHVEENVPALGLVGAFHLVGDGGGLTDMFGRVGGGVGRCLGPGGGKREDGNEGKQWKFHRAETAESRQHCRAVIPNFNFPRLPA